jgi:hypothetical protein
MSRTQSIIDTLIGLMQANPRFNSIRRYVTSGKDTSATDFPICTVIADEDIVNRIGSQQNRHELKLEVSFVFLDWDLNGNRHSYEIADALEDLLETNHTLDMTSGTSVSAYLTRKRYELDVEDETQVIDGVMCELEITYYSA